MKELRPRAVVHLAKVINLFEWQSLNPWLLNPRPMLFQDSPLTWHGLALSKLVFSRHIFSTCCTKEQIYNSHRLNDPRVFALEADINLCLSSLEMVVGGEREGQNTQRHLYGRFWNFVSRASVCKIQKWNPPPRGCHRQSHLSTQESE